MMRTSLPRSNGTNEAESSAVPDLETRIIISKQCSSRFGEQNSAFKSLCIGNCSMDQRFNLAKIYLQFSHYFDPPMTWQRQCFQNAQLSLLVFRIIAAPAYTLPRLMRFVFSVSNCSETTRFVPGKSRNSRWARI